MKFSIGDNIVLKRTGEEGHVIAVINDQMYEVEVNGTTFPVYKDDIDHPYLKWFTEKRKVNKGSLPEQLPVESERFKKPRLARGVYLSFVPVFKIEEMEDVVDYVKIHLLNELPVSIKFAYDVRLAHSSEFKHEGTLHEFGSVYLHNVSFDDMNEQPRFHWQLTNVSNRDMATAEGILRIRPAKLFEHVTNVLQKSEPTFSYLLIDDFKPKPKPEKIEKFEPQAKPNYINTKTLSNLEAPLYELDLHIERLVNDIAGLNNADMLKIQLDTLRRYLHLAIVHKQERMVIIHGLGKGVLRDEVHKILKRTPQVRLFTNEWQGQYGFGATEVYFKY